MLLIEPGVKEQRDAMIGFGRPTPLHRRDG
jgi:hypothetical protein